MLLRVRSLRSQAGAAPSAALWSAAWIAYGLLRLLPHMGLLALFVLGPGLPRAARVATLGLVLTPIERAISSVDGLAWRDFQLVAA